MDNIFSIMDDDKIVDLYWERSERAIIETDLKYGHLCKSIANNILANEEDAKECVNDAYFGAWNAMPVQRPKKLMPFLGRIIRNISLDRYDYNNAQKRSKNLEIILSELEDCLSRPGDNTESKYEEGEIARAISNYLRTIAKINRNIFIRRYWYSEPVKQIAAGYEMSESKVKSLLLRERKKLKKYLEKEGIII